MHLSCKLQQKSLDVEGGTNMQHPVTCNLYTYITNTYSVLHKCINNETFYDLVTERKSNDD